MTDRTQPEALRLAEILEGDYCPDWFYEQGVDEVAAELRRQHARIAELEAQLESIGAGGVNGPLIGQPQAMPDLSQLTERGAKAWAGVDAQGLRDSGASLSANAGEQRDLDPRHIRKFLQALQAGEMSVSRAVEILDAWVGGYYKDEMVPPPPPDSCLIADDEFPMEIVRKLRSELAAAPPTAQAEGWRPISTAPEGQMVVVGWLDKEDADNPERHDFDLLEDGCWMHWHEHAEHVEVIGGHGVSYTPPYTVWMPVSPIPTTSAGSGKGE